MLKDLKKFYKEHSRSHLPWRKTRNPYKILVSELMLQQTQVSRVLQKYPAFLKKFPTWEALAKASLADVLKEWQGLGYNRRARYLHQAAKVVSEIKVNCFEKASFGELAPLSRLASGTFSSRFTTEFLESLPGVGHYTARAVAIFAYNRPEVCIETNIRTVFTHYFYKGRSFAKVHDRDLLPKVGEMLKKSKMEPREFYAALMDYGSHLKANGMRINNKSAHYTKQSKFEGSTRQKRAAALRALLAKGASDKQLEKLLK